MAVSAMVTIKGNVLASRKVKSKNGKGDLVFNRVLIKDGYGIDQTVDVVSFKEKKVGEQEVKCTVALDRDKTNLRFFEGA